MTKTSADILLTPPATGFLRLDACLRFIPMGKTQWWERVKTGDFPQPVKLGPRTTAWRAEDIHALITRLASRQGARQ